MPSAFSMRSSASLRIWLVVMVGLLGKGALGRVANEGPDRVAGDGPLEVAFPFVVEDQDGEFPRLAHADRLHVHDAEAVAEHLVVGQTLEPLGVRVDLGVAAVDAIDAGGLEE